MPLLSLNRVKKIPYAEQGLSNNDSQYDRITGIISFRVIQWSYMFFCCIMNAIYLNRWLNEWGICITPIKKGVVHSDSIRGASK
jgi:hypothetical protein